MVAPYPVIGISGGNSDSASVRAMMTQIRSAGAIPIFLGNHAKRDAEADLKKIDALVVMGNNNDIDPKKYGQPCDPHTKVETDHARANYEEKILEAAIRDKMPVMGVCGGMQRLNVMFGGTLHQHIPDQLGHDEHAQQDFGIAPFIPVQTVHMVKDTQLGKIAGELGTIYTPSHQALPEGIVMENSMHHQAVANVGNGLRVCAKSDDHIIEAIEADPSNTAFKDQFILGVQWHPEFGASPLGAKLAEHFTHKAIEYKTVGKREHPAGEAIEENMRSNLMPEQKTGEQPKFRPGSMTDMILRQRAATGFLSRN